MNSLTTVCAAVNSIPTTTLHGGATSLPPRRTLSFSFAPIEKKNNNSSFAISTHIVAVKKGRRRRRSSNPPPASEDWELIEVSEEDEDDREEEEEERIILVDDEFEEDEIFNDEDQFVDDFETEDAEASVGDGAAGGGIKLAGTWWDKEALAIAQEVCKSLEGGIQIYAFRTLLNGSIQVRIEDLSDKCSSPSITDIEAYSIAYRARLDEAELTKSIPDYISLEVSSPGDKRVVRVPDDLDRFNHSAMYVKYVSEAPETSTLSEHEGIFRLVSYDLETRTCTWGLADVRENREKSGKGRPMNKKQREWRVSTSFELLTMVRLHPIF